jgi:hypothetical protein
MNREQILGIIRHILTFAGGTLVVNGKIDESTLTEGVGATLALIGILWSIIDKYRPNHGIQA